ncbi:MAG: SIMPL domain-containing protein [Candidatus Woesearchaeota archaeon]
MTTYNNTNITALVSVVALAVALISVIFLAGDKDLTQNTISVSGNAEMSVSPDKAEIHLSVITNGSTALDAQEQNRVTEEAVRQALLSAGIDEKDIETTSYNLHQQTRWDSRLQRSVETGYELRHTLKITIHDVERVGSIVDTAIEAGANNVQRISFGLSDELEKRVRDEALQNAGLSAQEKAQSIANTMNVRLGKVVSVQESNYYFQPYQFNGMMRAETAMDMAVPETQISPQNVEVRASMSVLYAIR